MLHKYRGGVVPGAWTPTALEEEIVALAGAQAAAVRDGYAALQPSEALAAAWALVSRANVYVEETKPWTLAREEKAGGAAGATAAARLDTVLATLLEVGRLTTRWAWPAIPTKAEEAWFGLGLAGTPGDAAEDSGPDAWFAGGALPVNGGVALPAVTILFPRLDPEKLAEA
jgi:methionyl-tRNA synthetase